MSYRQLTLSERETIANMHFSGHGPTSIARMLKRSPSTISRELSRNGTAGGYRAHAAHERSLSRRSQRPITRKRDHPPLAAEVRRMLSCCWSPDEASGRLRRDHPGDRRMHVSHQTIYRWLWSNPVIYEDLRDCLRHGRYRRRRSPRRVPIRNRVSIRQRPAVVEKRSRVGDWEGDTIVGKGHQGYVATFVDRRSGYLVASRMRDKRAASLNRAAERAFREIPVAGRKSLTVDNGTEFANHQLLSRHLQLSIYFADPYCSWQRGTNENTNGLLRQYFPKGTDLSKHSRNDLAAVAAALNTRPRKTLGWKTPAESLNDHLRSSKHSTVARTP
jgi:IS30 family transposase